MLAKSYGPDAPVVPTVELHIPVKYKYVCVCIYTHTHINTVITLLIDLSGFWAYNTREALVANDNENSTDLDDTRSLKD